VVAAARQHLGDRYVYGASGPSAFDCSGLTSTVWRTAGRVAAIPRTAAEQQAWATPVGAAAALPGDLVFFGRPATHVALYVGAGWIVDASSSRHQVVERPLWTSSVTYGRVPRATAPRPAGGQAGGHRARSHEPAPEPAPKRTHTRASRATGHRLPPTGGPRARALVRALETRVGAPYAAGGTGPRYDDGALIAVLWRRITGLRLPTDRTALARHTVALPRAKLRKGDVLIYGGAQVWHVGVYVGDGRMVDASRSQGRVVLRPVLPSGELRYGRLPRP
jgi:cell wall-associated NlpC family hydrolase